MATRREHLERALRDGDRLEDLTIIFERERPDEIYDYDTERFLPCEMIRGTIADLPNVEFDDGFGGAEGPRLIAFSDRFVYVCHIYDGAQDIVAVPRHPETTTWLPEVGGHG